MRWLGSNGWLWKTAVTLMPNGTYTVGTVAPLRELCIVPARGVNLVLEMPCGLRDSEPGWAVQRSIWTAIGPGPSPA